jgi:2,3-dihydroxyphenylpropionate 1,2-dioxygenase
MSHSPLMYVTEPAPGVRARVDKAFENARAFAQHFAPDLVLAFAPDHYNGFLYDVMPPFCVGATATSIGDYGTAAGPLRVDHEVAWILAQAALDADVDVALSEQMHVDHGVTQPLEILFGAIDAVPVIPVFINCLAVPLGPVRRARLLGRALGRAALALDRRVLFLGSGGLSHDPPVPSLRGAAPEVAATLISGGRNLTVEQRAARQDRVIEAGRAFAAGDADAIQPLNPEWDANFLAILTSGQLERFDEMSTDSFATQAGNSSHEARTSIAAYAALHAAGPYRVASSFYEPIPEWIAGFAITTASTESVSGHSRL